MTTGSSPVASSTASLMSDSTQSACVWAISTAPVAPAAAVANSWPSISRTAASTGSMPSRAHATSRNDIAGSTTQRTRSSARSARTERSSTSGEPGTAYSTSPCSTAAATTAVDDRRVDVLEAVGRLVDVVERRRRRARGRRSGGGPCAGSGAGCGAIASRGLDGDVLGPARAEPDDVTTGRRPAPPVTGRRRDDGRAGPSARSAGSTWMSSVGEVRRRAAAAPATAVEQRRRATSLTSSNGRASMTCQPNGVCDRRRRARRPRRRTAASTNVGVELRAGQCRQRHAVGAVLGRRARRRCRRPLGSVERSAASVLRTSAPASSSATTSSASASVSTRMWRTHSTPDARRRLGRSGASQRRRHPVRRARPWPAGASLAVDEQSWTLLRRSRGPGCRPPGRRARWPARSSVIVCPLSARGTASWPSSSTSAVSGARAGVARRRCPWPCPR